ncbi:MAG: FAD-dependent oxidoreductase [Suipraeoptans sp.]
MDNYDVCVIGGGTAGSFAAIAAAKEGLSVIIIEKSGNLGGTSTNGLVSPSMPTYVGSTKLQKELENLLVQIEGSVYPKNYYDELKNAEKERPNESSTVMYFSSEAMQMALETLAVKYDVDILYDTPCFEASIENKSINSVKAITCDGVIEIKASNFIDGSGDAVLAKLSDLPLEYGDEYGENQYTSLRFEVGNVNMDVFLEYMNTELKQTYSKAEYPFYTFGVLHQGKEQVLEPLYKQALKDKVINDEEYVWFQAFSIPSKSGVFTFNCPRIPNKSNIINPFVRSQNYIKGRQMIHKYMNFMTNYLPGFEDAYIEKIASSIGIRESVRVIGQYRLEKDDYLQRTKFEDGIVRADWWIDIHKKEHDPTEENRYDYKEYFEIPYRSMITNQLSNYAVIGRCISSDFASQASIRIQPQCRMMGEALAIACKISKVDIVELNKVDGKKIKKEMSERYE